MNTNARSSTALDVAARVERMNKVNDVIRIAIESRMSRFIDINDTLAADGNLNLNG